MIDWIFSAPHLIELGVAMAAAGLIAHKYPGVSRPARVRTWQREQPSAELVEVERAVERRP